MGTSGRWYPFARPPSLCATWTPSSAWRWTRRGPRCSPKSCAAISVSWFPSRERYCALAVGDFGRTAFYTPGPATDAEMYTFVLRAGDRAVSEVSGDLGRIRLQRADHSQQPHAALARRSKTPQGDFPNHAFTFDIPKHGPSHSMDD